MHWTINQWQYQKGVHSSSISPDQILYEVRSDALYTQREMNQTRLLPPRLLPVYSLLRCDFETVRNIFTLSLTPGVVTGGRQRPQELTGT